MFICNIEIFEDVDPFKLESCIISLQRRVRYWLNFYHLRLILKNFKILSNNQDPITLNEIKIHNINKLYPIFRRSRMYVYEIESLDMLISNKMKEVYSNTKFKRYEIKNIKKLQCKKVKKLDMYNDKEKLYFLKIDIFQRFFELKTYFTLELYEKINKINLNKIFGELRMMWTAYIADNSINENDILKNKLDWRNSKNIELKLLQNIHNLINCNLEDIFIKNICYIIIGAFSYVDPNIKKIYNNIDFI